MFVSRATAIWALPPAAGPPFLRSKALFGRITVQLLLKGLTPPEAIALFHGWRSEEEVLKYLLVFGGVPKYLEEVRLNRSFAQNMNRLCFSDASPLTRETERVFYTQFRKAKTYERIVVLLREELTLLELTTEQRKKVEESRKGE